MSFFGENLGAQRATSVESGELQQGNLGLSCRNISFTWNLDTDHPTEALKDVSFNVDTGQIVSVIGPTGCGKSTLLRIAIGLINPTSGEVLLDGKLMVEPTRKMGMIFQEHGLFPWMTVKDNIEFGLRIRHVSSVDRKLQSQAVLDSVGLSGEGGRYPHELSGGMKRRVAIARLLANDAEYLLMDEPFEALDFQTRLRMQQFLLSVHQKFSKSILLVTHQVDEALLLSDRILLMSSRPGRIARELVISLDRPRDSRDDAFNRYRAVVLDHLEKEIGQQYQLR